MPPSVRPFPLNVIVTESGKLLVQTPKPRFINLALEGCGVGGTGYVGLAKVLKEYGLLDEIENVAGSSAGAMAALIIALGYTPDEIHKKLCELPYIKFLEGSHSWSMTPELLSQSWKVLVVLLRRGHALSSGKEFKKWLEDLIFEKLGKRDATFADLEAKIKETKAEGKGNLFKHLFITATNISLATPESKTFCAEKTPNEKLADVVGASGAFPFVFPPVKIGDYYFSDGGLIKNLPACVFDDIDFIPTGFGFNNKGVNNATIAVKMDSPDEIAQFIWGINKTISLQSAREITYAICNALMQTGDSGKLREARTVIALPNNCKDGKQVQVLQFSLDEQGKLELITVAEQATKEFLEQHASEIEKAEVYDTTEEWLASLDLQDIDDLKKAYEKKLRQLPKAAISVADNLVMKHDPNNPTREALLTYLAFLDEYEIYRKGMDRYLELEEERKENLNKNLNLSENANHEQLVKPQLKVPYPSYHINLPLPKPQNDWNARIIQDMRNSLVQTEQQIELKKKDLTLHSDNLTRMRRSTVKGLHTNEARYLLVKEKVAQEEYLKFLQRDYRDLKTKLSDLDGDAKKNNNPDCNNNVGVENALSKSQSLRYEILCHSIQKRIAPKDTPWLLRKILEAIDLTNPYLVFQPQNQPEKIFHFDLRDGSDQKLYLLALGFFIQTRNRPKEFDIVKRLYHSLYPDEFPQSFIATKKFLAQSDDDLCASLYKIEELIMYFAQIENPRNNCLYDLDNILLQLSQQPKRLIIPSKPTPKQYSNTMFKTVGTRSVLMPEKLRPNRGSNVRTNGEFEILDPYLTSGVNSSLPDTSTNYGDTPGWFFKK